MSQRVVITAGAAGIGQVMARTFAAAGAEVWVTDVDEAALASVSPGIRASNVDVADERQMAAFFNEVKEIWGEIDVLCANAGIKGPTAAIDEMPMVEWRDCLAVNLDGAMLAAKHAAPFMKAQRSGVILFTSSTAGLYGFPYRAPYAAAKWAVIGLMKTVAMELGPFGIRANAIAPGSVTGSRIDRVFEAEAAAKGMTYEQVRDGYAAGTALGRLVDPEDIASMAVFLASDAARMVSGQVITVDGFTINPDPRV
ncbi:MAG: SDR family oxidoreductase [Rhodobacteraceae bacterium]|jgi:NAD(P)-dependent dehydrogenase (short-subunit alcohol dehydrogenase family)|uniref:SDR family oxidoreductase n=1 Tax=Albidovulum sp. TaxID=1872424 RepID=UPI001D8FE36E|nr:SDR family oxidoreductase [uncultured Defluviimonas sp.]MCB2127027.1 SDR family oxidoreductase [Paracoccaceae bacterium]MCC0070507.1 SDR family oxidoreductase [Paracoccaceae bacterium]